MADLVLVPHLQSNQATGLSIGSMGPQGEDSLQLAGQVALLPVPLLQST